MALRIYEDDDRSDDYYLSFRDDKDGEIAVVVKTKGGISVHTLGYFSLEKGFRRVWVDKDTMSDIGLPVVEIYDDGHYIASPMD